MLLQATYKELNGLIREKARIEGLSLAFDSSDTTQVSYQLKILGITSTVSFQVKVLSIEGSRITAEIHAGCIGDLILDVAKKSIIQKTPEGLIESFDNKTAVVNLGAIPELQSVFDTLTVNSISFTERTVCLDGGVK